MAQASMEFSMDDELIAPIVKANIQAAIVEALDQKGDIIQTVVSSILQEKVGYDGRRSNYSHDNKISYLEWLCRKAIQDAAKDAITQIVLERQDEMYAEVKRQIENSKGEWVQAMLTGISKAVESNWRFSVNVTLPE